MYGEGEAVCVRGKGEGRSFKPRGRDGGEGF